MSLIPGIGITKTGIVYNITDTGVTPGEYDVTPTLSVNNQGQITQVENNTIVESINSGTGITVSSVVNDQVTTSLVSVNNTTVVPETYSSPTITVNQQGQITNAYETIQDSPVNSAYIYDDFFNGPVTPLRGNNVLMGGDTLWIQDTNSGVGEDAYSVAENTVSSNECGVLTLYTSSTSGVCRIAIKKGATSKCTIYQTMTFEIRLRINIAGTIIVGTNYAIGGVDIGYNITTGFSLRYNNTAFALPFIIPVLGQWYKYTIISTPGFPHPILSFYIDNVKIVTSGITPGFPDFIPPFNQISTYFQIIQVSLFPTAPTTSTSIDYVTLSVVDNNPR
jgi:hypothetical protein